MAHVMSDPSIEERTVGAEFEEEELVAILDAGSQYGKVIDRRVRELCVATEILPLETPISKLKRYKAIIISGGPGSVYAVDAPQCDPQLFTLNIPILGICYGMHLLVLHSGGQVSKAGRREDGQMEISLLPSALWALLPPGTSTLPVLLTHGDSLESLPSSLRVTARSKGGIVAAVDHVTLPHYGLQFHPEVELTPSGSTLLRTFLFSIAHLQGSYSLPDRRILAEEALRRQVGESDRVLVLVSGGVDSSVCTALLRAALGPERVVALHIDNGFMRLQESAAVCAALLSQGVHVHSIDASQQFYSASLTADSPPLSQVIQPEAKRHIIGDTFMRVAQAAMQDLQLDPAHMYVAQGTLRPDLIESASALVSSRADGIKTHHNDTQLVRELRAQGKVLEPLRDYHKDEVRSLGITLGLPPELVWRQPFPGPGLAIRILCSVEPVVDEHFLPTQTLLDSLLHGNSPLSPQQSPSGWEGLTEGLAALEGWEELLPGIRGHVLPIRSVGVQGDCRSYRYAVALSGVPHWGLLFTLARLLPQLCHHVNRVVYVCGSVLESVPPVITPTLLSPPVIEQLRAADAIVNEALLQNNLTRVLSQVPVISVPLPFGQANHRSIVLRPFITNDFMTGVPAVPGREFSEEFLFGLVKKIEAVPGISRVLYDLTAKPPGTTEWE